MKKSLFGFGFLFFFAFFFFPSRALAEEIREFDTDIWVKSNGSINVVERIDYDFGNTRRHGIFRTIPLFKENKEGKKFELKVSVLGVEGENGVWYRYEQSLQDKSLRLKIGDPERTVSGVHTYIIKYNIAGALTYFLEHDELYWNVTGNEWEVPIRKAKAIVRLPDRVLKQELKLGCFTGRFGSKTGDCLIESSSDSIGKDSVAAIQFLTKYKLNPGDGLTIVVGWPKGVVAVLEPKPIVSFWDTGWGRVVAVIGIVVGLFWYLFYPFKIVYKWFKYGRDPKVGAPVRAWFDPPKTKTGRILTPGEVGTLVDETAHLRDISATIVDLARRGFLRIEERKRGDFWFMKIREFDAALLEFEKELLTGLFMHGDEVQLKKRRLYSTILGTKKFLYKGLVKENLFPENPDKIRAYYTLMGILGLFTLNFQLALVAFTFGRAMPRKTQFGAKATQIAYSLRNFLASQERRIEFAVERNKSQSDLNVPKQVVFENLLPYAVAFGVEKVWARRFESLAMQEPEWYGGYEKGVFNSSVLVSSLDRSFSKVAAVAGSPTSTSSSSGFSSGFSGGFSGGGGGGGGGGSW